MQSIGNVRIALVLGFVLAISGPVRACVNYADYSHVVSHIAIAAADMPAFATDGNNACICADAQGLVVVDISDPAASRIRTWLDTDGYPADVAMQGGYAYVAEGVVGLQIVEVSRFVSPHIVSTLDTVGAYAAVAVAGSRAYLIDSYGKLDVVDVSVPVDPRKVGSIDVGGIDVVAAGHYAYMLSVGVAPVLHVIDATEGLPPRIVATTALAAGSHDLAIGDGFVSVTGSSGLEIIDISDPATPHSVGFTNECQGGPVVVEGNRAYVAGLLVQTFDIRDHANPRLEGGLFDAQPVQAVAAQGDHAYFLEPDGLSVAWISDPLSTDLVGYLSTPEIAGLSVEGDRAYLATSYEGLEILDLTEPGSPVLTGTIDGWGQSSDIASRDAYAYVASSSGLVVVDVSNPAAPTIAGRLDIPEVPSSIALQGNLAYIGTWGSGSLQIVDISNPSIPFVVGEVAIPSQVFDVAVDGTFAYVADGDGLRVIDIGNPGTPAIVGFLALPASYAIAVQGGLACAVASGYPSDDMVSIDVSIPTAPRVVGHLPVAMTTDLVIRGNTADLATAWGLLVVDLSNPGALRVIGERAIPQTRVTRLAEQNGVAYLAGWVGFAICPGECAIDASVDAASGNPRGLTLRVDTPVAFGEPVTLRVTMPRGGDLGVDVFDVSGRRVAAFSRRNLAEGVHVISLDGRPTAEGITVPRGIYFVRAVSGRDHAVARIVRY